MKFPEIQELRTKDLILRKVEREDIPLYFQRIGSREPVCRYMLFQPHESPEDTVTTVEKVLQRYKDGRCYRWAIALAADNSIIGIIELLRFDEETGICSFAYMIGDEFWGRGYGTQALRVALDFGFGQMELSAVEADHMADNPASGAVMRKAGMEYVRTDAAKYEKNGSTQDAVVYRISRERWQDTFLDICCPM